MRLTPATMPTFGEGEPQFVDKKRKQWRGKGAVEIPSEMDEGKSEEHFDAGFGRWIHGTHAILIGNGPGRKLDSTFTIN